MTKLSLRLLVLTAGVVILSGCAAAERPTFGVTFDPSAQYLRIGKGTTDGLVGDYLGPAATRGVLFDREGREIGAFETVHADNLGSLVRVTSLASGRSRADVHRLSVPGIEELAHLVFHQEDSDAYFRLDKGRADVPERVLKRGAKGRLYDERGRLAAIHSIVAVGERESLAVVTQFARWRFAGLVEHVADKIGRYAIFATMAAGEHAQGGRRRQRGPAGRGRR